mmetsp:Transcript_19744/g.44830  ORF Transcript_19744/g.44830 Transcript_19744/m.44830 type:complete len:102 (+) Transcript_19744:1467-1772(+)
MSQKNRDASEKKEIKHPKNVKKCMLWIQVDQLIVYENHAKHNENAKHFCLGYVLHSAKGREDSVLKASKKPIPSNHEKQRRSQRKNPSYFFCLHIPVQPFK